MNKYTHGGWGRNIAPASKYPIIFAGRNTHVAQVLSKGLTPEEVEANADLIADAPNMREALDAIFRIMSGTEWDSDTTGAIAEVMERAGYTLEQPE